MERTEVSRNQLINQLLHIGHGNLDIYNEIGLKAAQFESELFSHLIAWNHKKGEVRDSKVAFPILALRGSSDRELYENAVAHLTLLDPRNFLRGIYYNRSLPRTTGGGGRVLKKGIEFYIRMREKNRNWWNQTALQHRKSLKALYALNHIKPAPFAQKILFEKIYPHNSTFTFLKHLKNMDPEEAAGTILNHKIPFITAVGALGGIKNKPDIILALIERMSGAELINNTQMLQRYGVFDNPPLKAAYDNAIERTKKDKRVSSLKATRASEFIKDKRASKKLKQIQEQRLQELGGIEGDWLVLGDRSGSMSTAINVARNVASLITKQVKGKVHLIFFNVSPVNFDVTGKSLEEITDMTKRLNATGSTSIGCGLDLLLEKGIVINGIVICSDGGDNTTPKFHDAYTRYIKKFGIEPTVYLFHVPGDSDALSEYCHRTNIMLEKFELGENVDFYSLPNIVKTLRTSRYSLLEEIMEMPLLAFTDVFKELN